MTDSVPAMPRTVTPARTGKRHWLRDLIARFRTEGKGTAAVEFAIVAPLLLAFYFLTMEFSQGLDTNKKVARVAGLVGDLVTQSPVATRGELDAVMRIGEAVLQPYNRTRPEIEVTAIQVTYDASPKAEVVWSRQLINGNFSRSVPPGSTAVIPQTLMTPGAFLIRTETRLDYTPVITWTEAGKQTLGLVGAFDRIDMGEMYYNRPRVSQSIPCANC